MKYLKTQVLAASLLILIVCQTVPAFAQTQLKTENYKSVNNPEGLVWTGKLFIYPSSEDNITKLYAVDPHDMSVNRFGSTFAAKGETHVVASSGIYFPSGYIYATSSDQIHEISADGNTVRVFTTPASGVDIVGLAFDNRGYWNYRLATVTKDGSVWMIDKNGDHEKIADLGSDANPTAVTVARDEFGDFSGDILVTLANGNKVVAVSHTSHNVSTVAEITEGTPKQILYIQTLSDMYVAEQQDGAIVKIDRDLVKDHLAEIMVVSEAKDNTISLTAIKSDRAGVKTATIATGLSPDIKEVAFVLDSELADAIKGPEPKGTEIDPLLIIIPIFAIVVVVTAIIIWRYRGF
jgi:hypothetical protein